MTQDCCTNLDTSLLLTKVGKSLQYPTLLPGVERKTVSKDFQKLYREMVLSKVMVLHPD